jgi:hypothetical protein
MSAVQVSAAAASVSRAMGLFTCLCSYPQNAATSHTLFLWFGLCLLCRYLLLQHQ